MKAHAVTKTFINWRKYELSTIQNDSPQVNVGLTPLVFGLLVPHKFLFQSIVTASEHYFSYNNFQGISRAEESKLLENL